MSNLILTNCNTNNNNFYDENGILEIGTGEILSDKNQTAKKNRGKNTR